jgi:hypothetical protein
MRANLLKKKKTGRIGLRQEAPYEEKVFAPGAPHNLACLID